MRIVLTEMMRKWPHFQSQQLYRMTMSPRPIPDSASRFARWYVFFTFFKLNKIITHTQTKQISAVPAVIGSWCWPILVGSMLSVAASNVPHTLVDFFHGIQVAITLALMTNIVQFAWWTCKKRRKKAKTHMECFWSVYVLLLSSCLVLVRIAHWTPTLEYFDENSNTNRYNPRRCLSSVRSNSITGSSTEIRIPTRWFRTRQRDGWFKFSVHTWVTFSCLSVFLVQRSFILNFETSGERFDLHKIRESVPFVLRRSEWDWCWWI